MRRHYMNNSTLQTPAKKKRNDLASIVHVAKLAGVSKATAARAFSNADMLNPETCGKVLDAAKKLNYTPNMLARGLRGGKTNTIGVVWSFSGDPSASNLTQRVVRNLEDKGYMTYVASQSPKIEGDIKILSEYLNRGVEGVVVQAQSGLLSSDNYVSFLKKFKAVVIVTDQPTKLGFDQVVLDRVDAYRAVARHFANIGRSRIAFSCILLSENNNKYDGFKDELFKKGIHCPYEAVIGGHIESEKWMPAFFDLLESKYANSFPFDAVMCVNDELAQLLMMWLLKKGYKIPQDVAIVGFNNNDISAYLTPSLASVDRCTEELAKEIETVLLNRLNNQNCEAQIRSLSMRLILRESAGEQVKG